MDEQRFDDLVRHVATTPRRHVLRTLLGGLAVGLGLPAATTANRKQKPPHGERQRQKHDGQHGQNEHGQKPHHKPDTQREGRAEGKRRRVTTQGPCGNGKGPDNACEQDRDCCTRLCDQKKGRCRCKKLGEGCTDNRNCCANVGQPMRCQSGSCQTVSQEQALLASLPPPDAPSPPPPPGPGCTPTTCAAQGKNCGMIADGCGTQIRCGPDDCGAGYSCTENVCRCPNGTSVCPPSGSSPTRCQSGEVCTNGTGACCTAQGKATACDGRECGPATDSCTGAVYACGPAGDDCTSRGFTCTTAGQCECPDSRATCPTSGASPTCCLTGQVCKDGNGVCCTPTTCAAQGGACGDIPDGCGGTLNCGSCACPVSGFCGISVVSCGSGGCSCRTTPGGEIFCSQNTLASIGGSCDSSGSCPAGYRCWQDGGCLGSGKCLRLC
jgi:hypothetical protein